MLRAFCLTAFAILAVRSMSDESGDDTMSYMQAAISIETGARHVGTGRVTLDDEEDSSGDLMSYVQSTVNVGSGVRHVGTGAILKETQKNVKSSCTSMAC